MLYPSTIFMFCRRKKLAKRKDRKRALPFTCSLLANGLALSVSQCSTALPKGEPLAKPESCPQCQSLSLWERWHCVSNDGEGEAVNKESTRPSPADVQAGKNECFFYIRFILVPLFPLRPCGTPKGSDPSGA